MTVAAVILAQPNDDILAPLLGQSLVRRLVDVAWSGGALPIIVVAPDPLGAIARAVSGTVAVVRNPAPPDGGPASQIAAAVGAATGEVHPTTAALVWPARRAWVDPETLTSLIEAHGADATSMLRPTFRGESGWPVLLPVAYLEALRGLGRDVSLDRVFGLLASAGIPLREIELGDPGVVHDVATAPDDLPEYTGPPEPTAGPPPGLGSGVAEAGEAAEGGDAVSAGESGGRDPGAAG